MARPDREILVRYVQEINQEQLLALPNVVGVGTGFRARGGEFTNEVCVQVFVQQKLAAAKLRTTEMVPRHLAGYEGADIRTDVIEARIPEAQQDTTRYRPVPGGCSIGAEARINAGTLGGWACDEADDTIVLLSNNHVISNLDTMPVLRRIVQPGRFDGGVLPADVIGRLKRHVAVNTVANPPVGVIPTSVVDAAIGSIDAGINIDVDVLGIGPAIFELRAPVLNMNVQKRGRTTLLTTNGRITTVGATLACTYRNRTRISRIQNAFRITSTDGALFSDSGDSGSVIFDQAAGSLQGTLPVVGLLYAGGTFTSGTPFTDAVDINSVFGALDLTTACTCVARALIRAIFGSSAAAGESASVAATERLLRRFRTRVLAESDFGQSIDELVTREAARVGKILMEDEEAFDLAVRALAPLRDLPTGPQLLEMSLDPATIGSIGRLSTVLSGRDRRLGRELGVIHKAFKAMEGASLREVLQIAERAPSKKSRRKGK
jgi:hypothetical protein